MNLWAGSSGIDGRVVKQMTINEFQEKYPSKWKREEAVKKLSDDEIDEIIESCGCIQGKIYYSDLKKKNQIGRYSDKYNDIAANVMRYLAGDMKGNIVFSPFSILMLLSIVADAVAGETKEQVLDVIGSDLPYEKYREMISTLQHMFTDEVTHGSGEDEYKTGGNVISSNAVCIRESIKPSITPGYEDRLAAYQGKLFASEDIVRDVNDWVRENTRGMITEIADESMNHMLACLMNAIAFEAAWDDQYEKTDIRKGVFTNADKSASIVRMLQSTENAYIENESFTGFVKPYLGREYSFMALLPKKKGMAFMKRSLDSINFTKMLEESVFADVRVAMPEFKYDFGEDLTSLFQNLGIETLFTDRADFSPMSSEWLKIDSIIHKAHIEVDRNGTKAAAVTAAIAITGCAWESENPKEVYLDRPFIYAIIHNETGLPVFVGTMNHAVGDK